MEQSTLKMSAIAQHGSLKENVSVLLRKEEDYYVSHSPLLVRSTFPMLISSDV